MRLWAVEEGWWARVRGTDGTPRGQFSQEDRTAANPPHFATTRARTLARTG